MAVAVMPEAEFSGIAPISQRGRAVSLLLDAREEKGWKNDLARE